MKRFWERKKTGVKQSLQLKKYWPKISVVKRRGTLKERYRPTRTTANKDVYNDTRNIPYKAKLKANNLRSLVRDVD